MPRRNHKRPHPTGWPGRLLAALPPCKALYPLYLARQLEVREERYASPLLPRPFQICASPMFRIFITARCFRKRASGRWQRR